MNGSTLQFDWDEANTGHIAKHDVSAEEAEEVLRGNPLDTELQIEDGDEEERLLQIGETANGRILQIVTTWRGGRVRVVSAWDAPRQLKTYYFAEMRRRHGDIEDSKV